MSKEITLEHWNLRALEVQTQYTYTYPEYEVIKPLYVKWSWKRWGYVYAVKFKKVNQNK